MLLEYLFGEDVSMNYPSAIVAGNLDGLHVGHMKLINAVKQKAYENGLKTAVVSFSPHPMVFFGTDPRLKRIVSVKEKLLLLKQHEIDYYIEIPFNQRFAALLPKEFISDVLVEKLKCAALVVGEDYGFGKGRAGDVKTAQEICAQFNVMMTVAPHAICGMSGEKISSSLIRRLISEKNFIYAKELLGYDYFLIGKGQVVQSDADGSTFMMNILVDEQKLLPPDGTYKTEIQLNDKVFFCTTCIAGRTVTVADISDKMVEAEDVKLTFMSYIRKKP